MFDKCGPDWVHTSKGNNKITQLLTSLYQQLETPVDAWTCFKPEQVKYKYTLLY